MVAVKEKSVNCFLRRSSGRVAVSELGLLSRFDLGMSFFGRKSKLSRDQEFQNFRDEWVKSDVFKEMKKELDEREMKKLKKAKKNMGVPPAPPPPISSRGLGRQYNPLTRCDHCNKDIDRENELFYTIGKEPSRSDKLAGLGKQRILSYHADCFREIAGDDFM